MSSLAQIVNSAEIFCSRLATRTKRVAAKSIAAIPAESIPFIGVAVLIADTGYELYAAGETVRDLDQLYSDLGMADEVQEDAMHSVCDPELPNAGIHAEIYSQHPIYLSILLPYLADPAVTIVTHRANP
jgi:hypothetical protein